MTRKISLIFCIVVFIALFGFVLRVYRLGDQPYWMDESISVLASMKTAEKGVPLLDSGWLYRAGITQTYIMAVSGILFGFSEFSMRIFSALIGAGFVLLLFFVCRKLWDERVALISCLLACFFYYQIAWSRQARMYSLLQFLFLVSVYFFYMCLEEPSRKNIVLLSVSTVLAILTHSFGAVLPGVYAIILFFVFAHKAFKKQGFLKNAFAGMKKFAKDYKITSILIAAAVFFMAYRSLLAAFSISPAFNLLRQYRAFIFNTYFALAFFSVPGFFLSRNRKASLIFGAFFIVPFYIISRYVSLFHLRYMFFIVPMLFIFSAVFISEIAGLVKNKFLQWGAVIFILLTIMSNGLFVFMPNAHYGLEPQTPQPDFRSAYDFANENCSGIIITSHPYISAVYGERKADYWLQYDMSGRFNRHAGVNENNLTERYGNLEVIFGKKDLDEKTGNSSFCIITDDLAVSRTESAVFENLSMLSFGEKFWSTAYVFFR